MSRRNSWLIGIGACCLIAALYFVYGRNGKGSEIPAAIIGTADSVQGQVESRQPRALEFKPLAAHAQIHNQEVVQTDKKSGAVLTFTTFTSIHLADETKFVVETDATRSGALIGTVVEGHVTVVNPGPAGLFRLFYQGREMPLDQSMASGPEVIQPKQSAPLSALVITATSAKDPLPDTATNVTASEPEPDDVGSDVLTNEDIVRQLRGQSGFFQRCYLTYIHRERVEKEIGTKTGSVTLSFRIQSNGKVSDAKLVRSDFKDEVLHHCVLEVLERTRFKPFGGETVPVLEFPIILQ